MSPLFRFRCLVAPSRSVVMSRQLHASSSVRNAVDLDSTIIVTKNCAKVRTFYCVHLPLCVYPFGTLFVLYICIHYDCTCHRLFQRIKQLQGKSSNDALYLRLAVEGGGCSGFKYIFKMEDLPVDKDEDRYSQQSLQLSVCGYYF
jgi:hypothetical protein